MEITRRTMLAGAAAATSFTRTALADWAPNPRYPDPTIKVLDPSFLKYRPNIVGVERLATGMTWSEGPVWLGDGRYLLWSDTPNNRIMRWDEVTGAVGVFRSPSNQANGNTRDRQGRAILALAGLTDPRVLYWKPAKWIARLRRLRTNHNLIAFHTHLDVTP